MNRILVIDDELGISDLICEALKRSGYMVETAFNGRQGVKRFNDTAYDLVVTDMCMPDLDGNGIIRHIRNSSRPLTPVIGISGTPWLLQGADCDVALPKPFPLRTLIESVKRLTRVSLAEASPPRALPLNEQPAF
jgi:DNA-binding response OmpR family regulator